MGYFEGFICVFLVVLGPHTCRAQSVIMWQTNRLAEEIDAMVITANVDAEAYVTELYELLGNLQTTATSNLTEVETAIGNFSLSVQLQVTDLIDESDKTDVNECMELVTPVLLASSDIDDEISRCIYREVSQAEKEVDLTVPYVDSQLKSLYNFQTLAQHCLGRYDESEQESADANQALACIWPLHRSAELFMLRFEFIVDKSLAKTLFNGYENRVATCSTIGIDALEYLANSTQAVFERMETCIDDASS